MKANFKLKLEKAYFMSDRMNTHVLYTYMQVLSFHHTVITMDGTSYTVTVLV